MTGLMFRTYSLVPRGGPGLACDDDGLALGPVVLAKRVSDAVGGRRYRLLAFENVVKALHLAYGSVSDTFTERRCRGLACVTQLLGIGADALARVYAVLLGFPEITPEGMAKLAVAASLRKFNPNWEEEARVPPGSSDGGQWTSDGSRDPGPDNTKNTETAANSDRFKICVERCLPLLLRRKPYGWSNINEFAYRRCLNECLETES